MHKILQSAIWLASSTTKMQHNQHLDFINCIDLALKLGSKLCQSLPAFHAYTGCDYTAAFYNKGKIIPLKIFSQNKKYQTVFISLTNEADVFNYEKTDGIQEFTAKFYGMNNCYRVNDARNRIFLQNYAAKEDNEHFLKNYKVLTLITYRHAGYPYNKTFEEPFLLILCGLMQLSLHASNSSLKTAVGIWMKEYYLKPTGFFGDQMPMTIQDSIEMTEDDDDDDQSTEINN